MSTQAITLKTVNELRLDSEGKLQRYYIAAYQRGYRWTPLQVTQLLEDIREFTKRRAPQPDDFYCLQPLVMRVSDNGGYEVVDGQQRLTTLLLILRHFNERLTEKYRQPVFTLAYETRPNLLAFLDDPTEELTNNNVDFFHLKMAMDAIESWFVDRESELEEIKSAFLGKAKVIWYEIGETEHPVDVFTRLNVGKIPLTNGELIRALFLKRSSSDESESYNLQTQIAYEWDHIEKTLQSDAFWYFVSNDLNRAQNRIGMLFELVANADGIPEEFTHDPYGIFFTFSMRLKQPGITLEAEWRKIKQTFLLLEEWYEDRVLFHMIGYLVSESAAINTIRELSAHSSKSFFQQRLRQEIFCKTIDAKVTWPLSAQEVRECVAERLDALRYPSPKIKSFLLLFNVASLLQNGQSNLRFQFDSFKNESWNIEHIRSVTADKPERHHERVKWLGNCCNYLESIGAEPVLQENIRSFMNLLQADAVNEIFDPLYDRVIAHFKENIDEAADHGIANLTLLDECTNKSYKNAVFAVKRQKLLQLDQAGIFVPLCTRNVFLKCYSPEVDNMMFWGEEDSNGYLEAMTATLVNFFNGQMERGQ
ncbi:DUF262 domain-containing protein [Pseudomonas nunensis]|uniref:DUF262 domain-containing protein n=1 Tax=Pseudomonas nunensis TaxID=2961896 RepID=UPI0006B66FA6|nr:DUF262 domain-containing protein [Pseudomonas nunensis]KOX98542.1 hypothetical protein AM274_30675 [Pseudomonas nunensis]